MHLLDVLVYLLRPSRVGDECRHDSGHRSVFSEGEAMSSTCVRSKHPARVREIDEMRDGVDRAGNEIKRRVCETRREADCPSCTTFTGSPKRTANFIGQNEHGWIFRCPGPGG